MSGTKADESKGVAAAPKKPRQGRSPEYPFIPLGKALEKAESFRVAEGGRPKHYSPRTSIAAAWGMGVKSGPTKQSIAALGHFGLFEFQGSGQDRAARLTDTAFQILLDKQPKSAERDALIKQIALKPTIHKVLWDKWQANLPSDPTLETFLVRDRGFSEGGAKDLIAEYKATLAFAKLSEPATIPQEEEYETLKSIPEIGDLVNVEIGGVLQLPEPKRVRAMDELDGQKWVFVEDHEAGVPMEQVQVIEKGGAQQEEPAADKVKSPPRLPLASNPPAKGTRREVFALDEGDVVLTFPESLSEDSFADLEAYFEVFITKAARRAGITRGSQRRSTVENNPEVSYRRGFQQGAWLCWQGAERDASRSAMHKWIEEDLAEWRFKGEREVAAKGDTRAEKPPLLPGVEFDLPKSDRD